MGFRCSLSAIYAEKERRNFLTSAEIAEDAGGWRRYTPLPMIKPRVDKLLDHSDSHYAAVVVSAKRARQINSYFHNLGEGGFGEYPPPMVETNAEGNYLTMALEELAEGKLKYEYRS